MQQAYTWFANISNSQKYTVSCSMRKKYENWTEKIWKNDRLQSTDYVWEASAFNNFEFKHQENRGKEAFYVHVGARKYNCLC